MYKIGVAKLRKAKQAGRHALEFAVRTAPAVGAVMILSATAQSPPVASPDGTLKFEVASVKPCSRNVVEGHDFGSTSPGGVVYNCSPLIDFVRSAYIRFANGVPGAVMRPVKIEGGPAWINTDLYQISAKAAGAAGVATIGGPMMRALLEERFKLKVHRETRAAPAYALVVVKRLRLETAKIGCIKRAQAIRLSRDNRLRRSAEGALALPAELRSTVPQWRSFVWRFR